MRSCKKGQDILIKHAILILSKAAVFVNGGDAKMDLQRPSAIYIDNGGKYWR